MRTPDEVHSLRNENARLRDETRSLRDVQILLGNNDAVKELHRQLATELEGRDLPLPPYVDPAAIVDA